jgi:hypothetical protein
MRAGTATAAFCFIGRGSPCCRGHFLFRYRPTGHDRRPRDTLLVSGWIVLTVVVVHDDDGEAVVVAAASVDRPM